MKPLHDILKASKLVYYLSSTLQKKLEIIKSTNELVKNPT